MRRLIALYDGLPDGAVSRRENPDEPHWGTTEELLAQMVEEVSVLVADKRRKEPRSLPRPWEKKKPARQLGLTTNEAGGIQATGVAAVLTATQMRGAVQIG